MTKDHGFEEEPWVELEYCESHEFETLPCRDCQIESLQAKLEQRDKVIERVFTLPKITQEITDTLTSNVLIEQGLGGWEWTQEAVDFIACLKQALENSDDRIKDENKQPSD